MAIEKKTKRNIAIVAVIVAVIIAILLAAVNCQGTKPTQENGTSTPTVSSDKAASSEGGTPSDATSNGEGQAPASQQSTGNGGTASGGESGGSAAGPAAPQHEHSWATRTVDDGDVWVVDQAAWDEKVAVGSHIECTCGINWGTDVKAAVNHCAETGCSRTVVTDYDWVHHDEVGHYEHMSHTETYCTGCGAVQ